MIRRRIEMFAMAVSPPKKLIVMELGDPVDVIQFSVATASSVAEGFRQIVKQAFGELPYVPEALPLKVEPNWQDQTIDTTFPKTLTALLANPETYLGWADHLDRAVKRYAS